jgi:hypothetical protein
MRKEFDKKGRLYFKRQFASQRETAFIQKCAPQEQREGLGYIEKFLTWIPMLVCYANERYKPVST